jgi:competence CoiA-like predicted nuclease
MISFDSHLRQTNNKYQLDEWMNIQQCTYYLQENLLQFGIGFQVPKSLLPTQFTGIKKFVSNLRFVGQQKSMCASYIEFCLYSNISLAELLFLHHQINTYHCNQK